MTTCGIGDPQGVLELARLGEVDLQKATVATRELDERVDRLDHPGAGGPSAADAGRERHDGRLAAGQYRLALLDRPRSARDACAGISSESSTSRMSRSTGNRFRASPIRPRWRSSRNCSCWTASNPFAQADPLGLLVPVRGRAIGGRPRHREEVVDHLPEELEELAVFRIGAGEVIDVRPALLGERRGRAREHPGNLELIVGRRHHRARAGFQRGERAVRVDPEVVDDRLHGEGQRVVEVGLGAVHDRGDLVLEFVVALRGHEERHPAAGHAAEHQEAPEVVAQGRAGLANDRLGELVGHPGDDPLERTVPVPGCPLSQAADVRVPRRRRRSAGRSRAPPGGRATPRGRGEGTWRSPCSGSGRHSEPCRRGPGSGSWPGPRERLRLPACPWSRDPAGLIE